MMVYVTMVMAAVAPELCVGDPVGLLLAGGGGRGESGGHLQGQLAPPLLLVPGHPALRLGGGGEGGLGGGGRGVA